MANAIHNYKSLEERRDAALEIVGTLNEAMKMMKKKGIDRLEIGNYKMVPVSLERLQKFSDDALMRIKRWKPPEEPPMAEGL